MRFVLFDSLYDESLNFDVIKSIPIPGIHCLCEKNKICKKLNRSNGNFFEIINFYSNFAIMCAVRLKKHWFTKNFSNGKFSGWHIVNKSLFGTILTK